MMKTIDVLGFGEPLMELAQVERDGEALFLPGFGGDVPNAVVAAARQGARAALFTALGDDAFGDDFLGLWDREGVDRSAVIRRAGGRTGAYFIAYGPEGHRFSYIREGSAASRVTPDELALDTIAAARVLHVSGISQAISSSCADAVFAALAHARASGTVVSYDTNLRLRLWPLERARAIIHAGAAMADIVKPSLDDAVLLTGIDDPDRICDFYLGLGPRIVALTLGREGTLIATPETRRRIPGRPVEAVDATGAGDTFTGAFLAEWLRTDDPFRAAEYGNAAAALATLGKGAVAPMPRRAQVERFMGGEAVPPSPGWERGWG